MEKIIYSDILNETELLRTLAKSNINSVGLRILNTYEVILYVYSKLCLRKSGMHINDEEQEYIYYKLLNPSCFADSKNVKDAINSFRDTGCGNTPEELTKFLDKSFKDKKDTIVDAFDKYQQHKIDNTLYDK